LPSFSADAMRIKQILLNLLSNAIKFTPRGGAVTVAAKRGDAGQLSFEVSDTGIGMSAKDIEIAFQPFGQVESGEARRYQGTGLGLPLARRLAELHGGLLRIESEPSRGTCVIITLPASRIASIAPLQQGEGAGVRRRSARRSKQAIIGAGADG
jgi:signal transduction histidine kinase